MKTLGDVLRRTNVVIKSDVKNTKRPTILKDFQDETFRIMKKLNIDPKQNPKLVKMLLGTARKASFNNKLGYFQKAFRYVYDHPRDLKDEAKVLMLIKMYHVYINQV